MRKTIRYTLGLMAAAGMTVTSYGLSINFDVQGYTGPSVFSAASPSPQHLVITTGDDGNPLGGTVTLDGGVILYQTLNLPANQTALYGTASFGTGLANPLTMSFSFGGPIQNFFLDVLNGQVFNVDYRVYDNAGNSAVFNLIPNLSSGATTIGFAATGTQVWVEALNPTGGPLSNWDFFVDNIHFNEALPPDLNTPDAGSTAVLLALGFTGLAATGRRMRR